MPGCELRIFVTLLHESTRWVNFVVFFFLFSSNYTLLHRGCDSDNQSIPESQRVHNCKKDQRKKLNRECFHRLSSVCLFFRKWIVSHVNFSIQTVYGAVDIRLTSYLSVMLLGQCPALTSLCWNEKISGSLGESFSALDKAPFRFHKCSKAHLCPFLQNNFQNKL